MDIIVYMYVYAGILTYIIINIQYGILLGINVQYSCTSYMCTYMYVDNTASVDCCYVCVWSILCIPLGLYGQKVHMTSYKNGGCTLIYLYIYT